MQESPPDLLTSFALQLAEGIQQGKPDSSVEIDVGPFADYIPKANPAFTWYPHNYTLAEVAQKIADGELKRVMIWVPPGTGKSETITRLLSSYYLHRFPTREVGLVSYGADLAEGLSGDAREYFKETGGEIDDSTEAKRFWKTKQGGGMWAAGFGGPIRGKRFHLGIIDDPHKGPEELESDAMKSKVANWYKRTWLNRQNIFFKEGATIVVVMQRLDEDDLCGWILKQPNAERWVVVALDAVKQDRPFDIPKGVTIYPDNRAVGEGLCPQILTPEYLAEQQADPDTYDAQFLQRPKAQKGTIFDVTKLGRCLARDVPPMMLKIMAVDLALKTKEKNDFTVAFPVGYAANGKYYLFRPAVVKVEAPEGIVTITARAIESRVSAIGVESVAFQASVPQFLRQDPRLAGVAIEELETLTDKLVAARSWSPLFSQGLFVAVDDGSGWIEVFTKELGDFPRGKHDDQVDAVGKAIGMIRARIGTLTAPSSIAGGKPIDRLIMK